MSKTPEAMLRLELDQARKVADATGDRLRTVTAERDRLRTVTAERDRLRAALEQVPEWEWVAVPNSFAKRECLSCGRVESKGHASDCPRQAALGLTQEPSHE